MSKITTRNNTLFDKGFAGITVTNVHDTPYEIELVEAATEGGVLRFRMTRSGDLSDPKSLTWFTESTDDVDPVSGSITFASGEYSVEFEVATKDDYVVEPDKAIEVSVYVDGTTYSATGYIFNNDSTFSIEAHDRSKLEGHNGSTAFTFTVTRSGDLSQSTQLDWRVKTTTPNDGDNTSAGDDDFVGGELPDGTLSFNVGQDSATITVLVAGDNVVEGDQDFEVELVGSDGNTLDDSPLRVTIEDDDSSLSIAPVSASKREGNDGSTEFTFTVTRSGYTGQASTANWAVTGSGTNAAASSDFTDRVFPRGTVSFGADEVEKVITIRVAGDSAVEAHEAFTVTLGGASAGTSISTASATSTITNDDASLVIAANSADKLEGNSNSTPFTFTVTRSGDTGQASTANWAVTGSGTKAANADDFINGVLPSGIVSFVSGAASATITVNVEGDRSFEQNEGFTVTLRDASPGTSIGTPSATGMIRNDDAVLAIAATSANKFEGLSGATTPFTFTVTRSGYTGQASTVKWAVTGSGTNAAKADDFKDGVLPSGTLSFVSGAASATITVNVAGDSVFEQNEGFAVTLKDASPGTSIGTASATGTIQNDDASLAIVATSASKLEGNSGSTPFTFTVTRSGYTGQASTANWAVMGSGTNAAKANDFINGVLPSGIVSFAAFQTSKVITVNGVGDADREPNENFTITLSNPSGGTSIATTMATGTIQNDDSSLAIAATLASQVEGNTGETPFTFTVTRSGYTGQASTANWVVSGFGTDPADGADFVGGVVPSGKVSFAAGETSKTISVAVKGDTALEKNENFKVTLSGANAGTSITSASANGLIKTDDASLAITDTNLMKSEGYTNSFAAYEFTVTRSNYTGDSLTVDWAVAGTGINPANGADFQNGMLPSGTVSFSPNENSKTIQVNVAGDSVVENEEEFTVTLRNASVGTIGTAAAKSFIPVDDVATDNADDVIEGGTGVDRLNGLGGDDIITGGGNADWLTGGSGADLFKYLLVSDAPVFLLKRETIRDFNAAEGDKIDLSAIDAISGTETKDLFTYLDETADDFGTTDASGKLFFEYDVDQDIGALFGSVNSDDTPEFAIFLKGVSQFSKDWLILSTTT